MPSTARRGTASILPGESGLRLLEWNHTGYAAVAQRLFEVVEGNLHKPVREQPWGVRLAPRPGISC